MDHLTLIGMIGEHKAELTALYQKGILTEEELLKTIGEESVVLVKEYEANKHLHSLIFS